MQPTCFNRRQKGRNRAWGGDGSPEIDDDDRLVDFQAQEDSKERGRPGQDEQHDEQGEWEVEQEPSELHGEEADRPQDDGLNSQVL